MGLYWLSFSNLSSVYFIPFFLSISILSKLLKLFHMKLIRISVLYCFYFSSSFCYCVFPTIAEWTTGSEFFRAHIPLTFIRVLHEFLKIFHSSISFLKITVFPYLRCYIYLLLYGRFFSGFVLYLHIIEKKAHSRPVVTNYFYFYHLRVFLETI